MFHGNGPLVGEQFDHAVTLAWEMRTTPECLNKLYSSMPDRVAACIAARGGHTKY